MLGSPLHIAIFGVPDGVTIALPQGRVLSWHRVWFNSLIVCLSASQYAL